MNQPTKRPPGRPKKNPGKSPNLIIGNSKKYIAPENKGLEYELVSPNGAVFMMRKASYSFYDEKTNSVRECRYCERERSIFTEEQSEKSLLSPLVFRHGRLFVPREKPNLHLFLKNHPSNEANGGSLFRAINTEKIASKNLNNEFLLNDAISLLRTKPLDELLSVALSFSIEVDRPVDEIKYDLMQKAKSSPETFIGSFDNPVVAMKARVRKAESYQIVKILPDSIKWFDTNKLIISVPAGQDPVDVFVRYCMTEAAAPLVAEMDRQLG